MNTSFFAYQVLSLGSNKVKANKTAKENKDCVEKSHKRKCATRHKMAAFSFFVYDYRPVSIGK